MKQIPMTYTVDNFKKFEFQVPHQILNTTRSKIGLFISLTKVLNSANKETA